MRSAVARSRKSLINAALLSGWGMNNVHFNTDSLSAAGGGFLVLTGLLVLAMVAACRCHENLAAERLFRRAVAQVSASLTVYAVLLIMMGIGALSAMESSPSRDGIRIFFIVMLALVVAQVLFLAAAVRNLFSALDWRNPHK